MSIIENITLSTLKNYSKGGFIQTKKETKISSQMASDLKIKAVGLNQKDNYFKWRKSTKNCDCKGFVNLARSPDFG